MTAVTAACESSPPGEAQTEACQRVPTWGCEYAEMFVYRGAPDGTERLEFSRRVDLCDASVRRSVKEAIRSTPDAYVYVYRRAMGRRQKFLGQYGRGAGLEVELAD